MRKPWENLSRTEVVISLATWVWERIVPGALLLIGGSVMGYLASITGWVNEYGPIAWGIAAILSALVLVVLYYIASAAHQKFVYSRYSTKVANRSSTNPLAKSHSLEQIKLNDFFHPNMRPTKYVNFEDCELYGPCSALFAGCNFAEGGFYDCEIVIIRPDRQLRGLIIFDHCRFLRCDLYRVTLFMVIDVYNDLPPGMKANVPVVSDGRVGDI